MNIYVPSSGPDDWQRFLAEPEKHWRPGFSAQAVAHSWEGADGVPAEIDAVLGGGAELLIAIPEHKVPLPGGNRASQCDVFALVRQRGKTIALAVEGKVHEAFGPSVGEWYAKPTKGKSERLRFIEKTLGRGAIPPEISYQLLHRTVAAIVEARRFKTDRAAMIVQSFTAEAVRFGDYALFASFLGVSVSAADSSRMVAIEGVPLTIGWARGDLQHLQPLSSIRRDLYEEDFFAWSVEQGAALRRRSLAAMDWSNLAEEIESLGRSERYEIENRLKVLLVHLLKWRFQPDGRKGGWKNSIREQRLRIARRIKQSPSLRNYPAEALADEYSLAVPEAADETGLPEGTFPAACPFTIEQILDSDWLPD